MAGFDFDAILQQAQALQEQLKKTQDDLGSQQVTGQAGGGLVTVTATGKGELLKLQIDPKATQPLDLPMLEDLVLAAVNAALSNARALAQQQSTGALSGMAQALGGLGGLGGPGGFGGGFGGGGGR